MMPSDGAARVEPRVLLIRPTALGDVLRTVPALTTLRRALPGARIDWLVHEAFADAVCHHPALDEVVRFPRRKFGSMLYRPGVILEATAWARALRARAYQIAIDLQGLLRSGLLTRLTGAKERIGFANARELAWLAYNRRHHVDFRLHAVDRILALLEAAGYPPAADMALHLGAADAGWRDGLLGAHGGADQPYAVLAPTARWRCKCWPIDRYRQLAGRLLDSGMVGERLVVLAAPEERGQIEPLLAALGWRALAPHTTVGQMLALVSRARLLVANDSAPLHAAVGFGRPLVAIYGPTDPALVGPYRRADCVVRPPGLGPRPLGAYRHGRDDQSLIATVSVDAVWERVEQQLAAPSAR